MSTLTSTTSTSSLSFSPLQIFLESYPPEAADFCNSSNNKYFIQEIDPQEITRPKTSTSIKEDGSQETVTLDEMETVTVRRFQIQEVPLPSVEELASRLRSIRDSKLSACDFKMASDVYASISASQQKAWVDYRQALRDLPSLEGFPWDGGGDLTPWPSKPE